MALDLWLREDVLSILASTHEAVTSAPDVATGGGPELDAHCLTFADGYELGFTNALRALSLSLRLAVADGSPGSQERTPGPGTQVQAPPEELGSMTAGSRALNQDGRDRG